MCSSLCPTNYYYPQDQTTQYYCKSCDASCFRCVDSSASDCSYCNKNKTSNKYFFPVSGSIGMCSSLCPTNYYYPQDQTTQYYCKSCDASCFRCVDSSASDCSYCNKNKTSNKYFFPVSGSIGMCSSLCPTNYYYPQDQTTQYYCKSCDASCFRCVDSSASDCT